MQTATISKAIFKFTSKFYIQNLWHSFIRDNSFLQTPTKSPRENKKPSPSASRHINNSLNVYLLLCSERQIKRIQ